MSKLSSSADGEEITEAIKPEAVTLTSTIIHDLVLSLHSDTPLAVDIETTGFSSRNDRIVVVGISDTPSKVYTVDPTMLRHKLVKRFLEEHPLILHNGKFDVAFLKAYGIDAKVTHDTMLEHYTITEEKGTHSLDILSRDFLQAESYKAASVKHIVDAGASRKISQSTFDGLRDRVVLDTSYTMQLHNTFDYMIDDKSRYLLNKVLIPAQDFLRKVESRGIYINLDRFEEVADLVIEETQQAQDKALEHAQPFLRTGEVVNLNSPIQIQPLIYKRMGLKPRKGFKQNTEASTLKAMPQTPFIQAFLSYRKQAKLLSTYINGMLKHIESDDRIHSTFLLHGTVTGRLSSRSPNLQNIPRESPIKSFFQAPEGYTFVEVDISQGELRVLAHLSKDEYLTNGLSDPKKSIHRIVAEDKFGPNYTGAQYVRTKNLNFGLVYGRGANSIAQEFNETIKETQKWIDIWFESMPEVKEFLKLMSAVARKGGTIVSPFGRRRRFSSVPYMNGLKKIEAENEGKNFLPQNICSDIMLLAAIRAQEVFDDDSFFEDTHIVNLVHDSGLVETPTRCVKQVQEVMEEMYQEDPDGGAVTNRDPLLLGAQK